jgi:hypothetical protein
MINLGNNDDPYLIFESLNFKGEPLTQADLVRNYVLMRFRHSLGDDGEQTQVYRELWYPLESRLEGDLTSFLRHYAMRNGANVKLRAVYSAYKAQLGKFTEGAALRDALEELARHSEYYQAFIHPERGESQDVQAGLEAIVHLDVTTCYPFLLRLFDARAAGECPVDDLIQCLQLIESFTVRRLVCGVPTNVHERLVHTLGNLTLTAYNSELSNLPFDEKKSVFGESHIELSRFIAKQDTWGQDQIETRSLDLAERAMRIWARTVPTSGNAGQSEGET